jgi:3-hydroxyisobutyrate dehydrogenase-like beta-hydroxyacid dehydrogenase
MASAKNGVGIIGMGIMGGAFAHNLVAGGWRVIGYDVDPKTRRAMARAGVGNADDASMVAAKVRTIITSLPHPDALHATVAAIVAAKVRPLVVVEASTFTVADKLKAERSMH